MKLIATLFAWFVLHGAMAQPPVNAQVAPKDTQPADMTHTAPESYQKQKAGDPQPLLHEKSKPRLDTTHTKRKSRRK